MPDPLFAYLQTLNTSDSVKADAWDHFHESRTPDDFHQRFSQLDLPQNTKADLWDLKWSGRVPHLPHASAPEKTSQPAKLHAVVTANQRPGATVMRAGAPSGWDRIRYAIMGEPGEETLLGRAVHNVENLFESKEDRYKRALATPYNRERNDQGKGMRLLALEQLLPESSKPFRGHDTLKFVSELTDPRPLDTFVNSSSDLLAPESEERLSPEDHQRVAKMNPRQRNGFVTRRRFGRVVGSVNEPLLPINEYWRSQTAKISDNYRNRWPEKIGISAANVLADVITDATTPSSLLLDKGIGAAGTQILSQGSQGLRKLSPRAAAFTHKYGPRVLKYIEHVPAAYDAVTKLQEAEELRKKGDSVRASEKYAEAGVILLKELITAKRDKSATPKVPVNGSTKPQAAVERHVTGAAPVRENASLAPEHKLHAFSNGDIRNKPELIQTQANAHPVAGQIPRISDRVKMRDEPKLEGKPNPVDRVQAERIGGKDSRSGRQIVQPSKLPVQNDRLAAQNAPHLETKLSEISSRVPETKFVRLRPQKNLERVQQKVKEGKPAQTISDYLAAQIAADTPEAKDQIIQKLHKEFKVIHVDDKFVKGRPDKGGYPSANVQVKFPNGGTAEVQIVPREAQQITDTTHHLYKVGRNARDAGDTTHARQALDQARKLNQEALKQFQHRNQLSKGQTVTLTGGGQATVQYVSPTMNVVRVRTDGGKTRTVRLSQIQKGAIG